MRCFLAVDLPEAVREAVALVQARLRAEVDGVRWVAVGNLHLTLRFLGEIDEAAAREIVAATEGVTSVHAPVGVEAAGLGVFPGPVRPRVVWVGLGVGSAEIGRLARGLEQALAAVGFRPEPRPFRAHLTLGRIRPGGRGPVGLAAALESAGAPRFGAWTVPDVVLYRSHLGPRGSRYEELHRLPLAGRMPA